MSSVFLLEHIKVQMSSGIEDFFERRFHLAHLTRLGSVADWLINSFYTKDISRDEKREGSLARWG